MVQLCPNAKTGDRRWNKISTVDERHDHRCGDDLVDFVTIPCTVIQVHIKTWAVLATAVLEDSTFFDAFSVSDNPKRANFRNM